MSPKFNIGLSFMLITVMLIQAVPTTSGLMHQMIKTEMKTESNTHQTEVEEKTETDEYEVLHAAPLISSDSSPNTCSTFFGYLFDKPKVKYPPPESKRTVILK